MQATYSTGTLLNKDILMARNGRRSAYTSVGFIAKPQF